MKNGKPWTDFWKYSLECVCYIPWGTSILHRKQLLEKVTSQEPPIDFHPVFFNSSRFLRWKIILQPKEQSFWLEIHSYWSIPFLPENKIQFCI